MSNCISERTQTTSSAGVHFGPAKYTALDVAKYIVKYCIDDGNPITHIQLQKILFFVQVHFLANFNRPLFKDDIEAWKYGPVVPDVYSKFHRYASLPINWYLLGFEPDVIKDEDKLEINRVINEKTRISVWALVNQTHEVDGAWYKTFDNGLGEYSTIPPTRMKKLGK